MARTPSAPPHTETNVKVVFGTLTIRRISASQFGFKLIWGGDATSTNWDYDSGTPDNIEYKCDGRAQGSITPPAASSFPEFIIDTTTTDPRTIFAQYPWFCLHNPFPIPVYINHISTFESM